MGSVQLTRATYEKLKRELEDLESRGRVEVAQAIEQARALGDLSENGDYHAAKDAKSRMEARIRQLRQLLAEAEIVETPARADEVIPGVIVHLRFEGDETTEAYMVASIEEATEGVTVVSPNSPLGKALLGRKAGEKVEYEAPNGRISVEIVRIGSDGG